MSIMDGYEQERRMRISENERIAQEKNEKLKVNFDRNMPCLGCKIVGVCKYAFSIKPIGFNSEVFKVDIRCKKKDGLGIGDIEFPTVPEGPENISSRG